jgi:catechol 2,3-dioxygenase-like lactoylglutathione lyase family enzyme
MSDSHFVFHTMHLSELAYFTDDVPAMADFYRRLLNAEPVAQSDGMAIFVVGSTRIFIHRNYVPAPGDLPPANHTAFNVDDVDAACNALVKQGLTLEVAPQDYYWGRSAYLRDPDGHQIEIMQASPDSTK